MTDDSDIHIPYSWTQVHDEVWFKKAFYLKLDRHKRLRAAPPVDTNEVKGTSREGGNKNEKAEGGGTSLGKGQAVNKLE
jgi:hypothetical protein